MSLDTLASRERHIALFERYAGLLNQHQRDVLDAYLRRDWSLAEIARWRGTSRAAVHDLIRRAVGSLEGYEVGLGLVGSEESRRANLRRLEREIQHLGRRLQRLERLTRT